MSAAPPVLERSRIGAADWPRLARQAIGRGARHEGEVDEAYFLARMRASLANAEATSNAVAKLVHFDLAGRYSIEARRAAARR